MPYANFDDVQSIKTLYYQSLMDDGNMDVFEFVGEKLLTAGLDPFEQDEETDFPLKHSVPPVGTNASVQIESGAIFHFPVTEINIAQPLPVKSEKFVFNSFFHPQEFHPGIFHPPLS